MAIIYLIGFMGTGKTTLGRPLAKALGREFIDLDEFIEKEKRLSIPELFAKFGEEEFREMEREALVKLSDSENLVLATGGGTPCFFENMRLMKKSGRVVLLTVSIPELLRRLIAGGDKRPLVKNTPLDELEGKITTLLNERSQFYQQADIRFFAEHLDSVEEVNLATQQLVKVLSKGG